jgi:hypothetical protein
MPQYETGKITRPVGAAAVEPFRLVKTPTAVAHNTDTSTDDPIGASQTYGAANGKVMVRLLSDPGTFMLEAAGAAAAGAKAFAADDGKVQALPTAAGTYRQIGYFLDAPTADGDVVEVLPYDFDHTETVTE